MAPKMTTVLSAILVAAQASTLQIFGSDYSIIAAGLCAMPQTRLQTLLTACTLMRTADSGPYGPQPYMDQILSGEVVIDPFVIAVTDASITNHFQLVPNVSLAKHSISFSSRAATCWRD